MTPPRPNLEDPTLTEEAVQAVLPSVLQWAEVDLESPEADDLLQDLHDLMKSPMAELDGLHKAMWLGSKGTWEVDLQLALILERILPLRQTIYSQRVERWVVDNCILPIFDVGHTVTLDGNEATVQGVLHKEARYQVAFEGRTLSVPYEQVCG